MRRMADGSSTAFTHRLAGRPSITAESVCFARAVEHLRPEAERIVDDPYAQHFLGRAARAALAAAGLNGPATRLFRRLDPGTMTYVPARHRYIDDALLASLRSGVEQVVLLGAGYDSRAYRFVEQLAGRPVFEVDLAPISRRKARTIERHRRDFPDAEVHRVEIDFEAQTIPEALAGAGFPAGRPTFVVWEGVCMYLTRAAVKATLRGVWDAVGPGSTLAMDAWYLVDDPSPRGTAERVVPAALSAIGEAVTFGIHHEEMPFFMSRLGWDVVDVATTEDLAARYAGGRGIMGSMYLLTARRSDVS
jgi:methyltransferase (TIGR00027 family)